MVYVSTIKEATQDLHTALEEVPFNIKMFKGEQTPSERQRYLQMWQEVFTSLDPLVPESLKRVGKIKEDLSHFEGELELPEIVDEYIEAIATTEYPSAHIYLNYMGFLYGGQIMKKLYPESSSLYEFNDIKSAREEVRAEHVPKDLNEDFVHEVRCAFQYHIDIAKELGE